MRWCCLYRRALRPGAHYIDFPMSRVWRICVYFPCVRVRTFGCCAHSSDNREAETRKQRHKNYSWR